MVWTKSEERYRCNFSSLSFPAGTTRPGKKPHRINFHRPQIFIDMEFGIVIHHLQRKWGKLT